MSRNLRAGPKHIALPPPKRQRSLREIEFNYIQIKDDCKLENITMQDAMFDYHFIRNYEKKSRTIPASEIFNNIADRILSKLQNFEQKTAAELSLLKQRIIRKLGSAKESFESLRVNRDPETLYAAQLEFFNHLQSKLECHCLF